ncbi:hypothetical protein [Devosia sp.]|uniref:hypothetical protein n=1 Tax=Devosia sp. TaxID=1871048 RepID=UPI001AC851D6|nr:hypothetical protein [Devosia sp.]MBN9335385.1 hypothetical protein [Devosia sp.]
MSGMVGIIFKDGIQMYTDGTTYDEDGVCRLFNQKTDIMLPQETIMASRGSGRTGLILRMMMTVRTDFDDISDHLKEDLENAIYEGWRAGDACNLAVLIGGWSEREKKFRMGNMYAQGEDPWNSVPGSYEMNWNNHYYAAPWPDHAELQAAGIIDEGQTETTINLGDDAQVVLLMEAMRRTRYQLGPETKGTGCLIGGFIQRTTLQRGSACTFIIHRWPDKIGEHIGVGVVDYRAEDSHEAAPA